MVRFNCQDPGPRPESYYEDYSLANQEELSIEEKASLYWEMKTGAETGWDYSTRWMIKDGERKGDIGNTKPRSIIPVDLNAFLVKNAQLMAKYAALANPDDKEQINYYKEVGSELVAAMDHVLWNEEDGTWYDYDILNGKQRRFFTPSNLIPLWTEAFSSEEMREKQINAAVDYLIGQNLDDYPGGVPVTFTKSKEQWDFPNAWPNLEHMLVEGLEKTGLERAKELAFKIAERRVRGAYVNYKTKGYMFEKVKININDIDITSIAS